MKWTKTKLGKEEYQFVSKNEKTNMVFYIYYAQGDLEVSSFFEYSDTPFYLFAKKIKLNYKDFYKNEFRYFEQLLVGNTATKLRECAQELVERSEDKYPLLMC